MKDIVQAFFSGSSMIAIATIIVALLNSSSKSKESGSEQREERDSTRNRKFATLPANTNSKPMKKGFMGLLAILLSQAGVALYLFGPDAHEPLSKGDAAGLLTSFMLFLSGCSLLLRG